MSENTVTHPLSVWSKRKYSFLHTRYSAFSTDMRNPGLEPGSLAALEPESSASANSASSANLQCIIMT